MTNLRDESAERLFTDLTGCEYDTRKSAAERLLEIVLSGNRWGLVAVATAINTETLYGAAERALHEVQVGRSVPVGRLIQEIAYAFGPALGFKAITIQNYPCRIVEKLQDIAHRPWDDFRQDNARQDDQPAHCLEA